MRENFHIKIFEQNLKRDFGSQIADLSANSMTPFFADYIDGAGEYVFVCKAEEWLYRPLKGKTVLDTVPVSAKSYMEGSSLIWGFDIAPDINLESEIPAHRIVEFLERLYRQDKLNIVVIDHLTLNIVWLTNDYPFAEVKEQFTKLFKYYGII